MFFKVIIYWETNLNIEKTMLLPHCMTQYSTMFCILFDRARLPILTLLYTMLYIMLACLMLLTDLSNAVCLYNDYLFFAIDFCKCFLFSCFFLGLLTHSLLI